MGLRDDAVSPCENTWTGKHTEKCGHEMPAALKLAKAVALERNLPMNIYDLADQVRVEFYDPVENATLNGASREEEEAGT